MRGFQRFAAMTGLTLALGLAACTASKDAAVNASTNNNPTAETTEAKSIIGGHEVAQGSDLSKSVVLLMNAMTSEACSAALIGGNYAITAAHCVEGDTSNMYVFFAAKPNRNTERRQVVAVKPSPYYEARKKEDTNTSDIAIVKFDGLMLPKGYEAVQFLDDTSTLTKGTTAIVLGYGITDAKTQVGAGQLRFTTLQISDPKFSPTELLLDQSKGTAVCHGDSGGPAFVYKKDKSGRPQFYLWGIANHASKDDVDNLCDKSVIYTNATLFKTWIDLTKQSM